MLLVGGAVTGKSETVQFLDIGDITKHRSELHIVFTAVAVEKIGAVIPREHVTAIKRERTILFEEHVFVQMRKSIELRCLGERSVSNDHLDSHERNRIISKNDEFQSIGKPFVDERYFNPFSRSLLGRGCWSRRSRGNRLSALS